MGQAGFLCVLLLRRQDGWFCAKLDGWAWATTTATFSNLLSAALQQSRRASAPAEEHKDSPASRHEEHKASADLPSLPLADGFPTLIEVDEESLKMKTNR